jgi:hypothetical protein
MRTFAILLFLSVCCGFLWLPFTSEKRAVGEGGFETWEVTRYGLFGYRTTEKCFMLCCSFEFPPGPKWPPAKAEFFPVQLGMTIGVTVALVLFSGSLTGIFKFRRPP